MRTVWVARWRRVDVCAAVVGGRCRYRQPGSGGLEGAAPRVLLHGPHGALFLRGLARQGAGHAAGLGCAPRFAGLGGRLQESAPLGRGYSDPRLELDLLIAGAAGCGRQAAAPGGSGGGGCALRDLHPHQRCVSQLWGSATANWSRSSRARSCRNLTTRDLKQDITCVPLSGERQPLLGSRRDIADIAARRKAPAGRDDCGVGAAQATCTGLASGTSSRNAVRDAPQTQPVSSPVTSASLKKPSVDQWPKTMRGPRQRASRASNQGIERFGLSLFRRSLGAQHQPAVRIDVAQAREAVGDEAQALLAFERIVPAIRLIAVQPLRTAFQDCAAGRSRIRARSAAPRFKSHCGARPACSMHTFRARILVQQRPLLQPFEQRVAVRRRQDLVKRIVAAQARDRHRPRPADADRDFRE